MEDGAIEYKIKEANCNDIENNRVSHFPMRAEINPEKRIVKIANPRKTDSIKPSSKLDAPTSTM